MPEHSLRRIIVGLKAAQAQFKAHVKQRLLAEGGGKKILRDMERLAVEAREFERQMSQFRG